MGWWNVVGVISSLGLVVMIGFCVVSRLRYGKREAGTVQDGNFCTAGTGSPQERERLQKLVQDAPEGEAGDRMRELYKTYCDFSDALVIVNDMKQKIDELEKYYNAEKEKL